MNDFLNFLENYFKDSLFLVANEYSLADIYLTVYLARLELLGYSDEIKKRKNLRDFNERAKKKVNYGKSVVNSINLSYILLPSKK